MTEILGAIAGLALLVFVIGSMLSMGLSLKVGQIIAPLKNVKLVILALVANFILVPIVAYAITMVLPLDESVRIGLILLATAAGAPFLPKLAGLAKGDPALAVGSMVLLMVATVVYAPIVVPLVVEGAEVDTWEIASSLIVLMLIPLGLGLFAKARYQAFADGIVAQTGQIANVGLLVGIVAALLVSWRDILGAIGSWIFVGIAIVLVSGLVFGYLAGFGRSRSDMVVLGLATAQRNIAAALVVAASLSGDVVVLTLVGALVLPVVLIVVAGELGRRATPDEGPPSEPEVETEASGHA